MSWDLKPRLSKNSAHPLKHQTLSFTFSYDTLWRLTGTRLTSRFIKLQSKRNDGQPIAWCLFESRKIIDKGHVADAEGKTCVGYRHI